MAIKMGEDYRISLDELKKVRNTCFQATMRFQEFVDHEKFRGNDIRGNDIRRIIAYQQYGDEDIIIPSGVAKGEKILAAACSVPNRRDYEKGDRAYCHVVYVKDDQSCGDVRGGVDELLPEKYKWMGEPY